MQQVSEKWEAGIGLLKSIQLELQLLNAAVHERTQAGSPLSPFVHLPFKGAEIYLLIKAFVDAGGAPNDNYKSLLERTVPFLANKTQKGFSAPSFCKYSDKVDPEAKDTVRRFLQRMLRNLDSYD